jgi:hypothetical protein
VDFSEPIPVSCWAVESKQIPTLKKDVQWTNFSLDELVSIQMISCPNLNRTVHFCQISKKWF